MKKYRIGLRCYEMYVPNEIWDIFKRDLRKLLRTAMPEVKFSVTEFYWQAFSTLDEYIRIEVKTDSFSRWGEVQDILDYAARYFRMEVKSARQEGSDYRPIENLTEYRGKYISFILKNTHEWSDEELDDFQSKYDTNTLLHGFQKRGKFDG